MNKIYENPKIIKLIPNYNIKKNIRKGDTTAELAKKFYKRLGVNGLISLTNKKKDIAYLKFILPFLKKEDKVLDLACGYGRITFLLAKKGFKIEGIDLSSNLIKYAKKEAKKRKLKIKFKIGDFRKSPYKDESFDKIICLWSSFNHLLKEKDQVQALNEMYRILKKGGLVIIDLPNGESKWAKTQIKKHGRIIPDVINDIKLYNYIHNKKTLEKLAKKSRFKRYKIKFANIIRRRIIFILWKTSY